MSLRTRILLIVLFGFIGLTAVVFVFARISVDGAFDRLERKAVGHDAEVVVLVYHKELSALERQAVQWSTENEVLDFVTDEGDDPFSAGRYDSAMWRAGVSFAILMDEEGNVVAERAVDPVQGAPLPVTKSIHDFLAEDSYIRVHHHAQSRINGILRVVEGPLLVTSVPVLPSEKGALIQGTLILGRWWEHTDFVDIAKRTGLGVYYQHVGDHLAPDFSEAMSRLSAENTILTQTHKQATVSAYTLLHDIYGKPTVILRLMRQRDGFLSSFAVSYRVVLFTVGAGIFFMLVALLMLEKTTLSRFRQLVREVRQIESLKHIATAKVTVEGKDEIGRIAEGVRYILSALKVNRFRWIRSEKRLQSVVEALPAGVVFLDMQTYAVRRLNTRMVELLGAQPSDLLGRPFEELVALRDGESWADIMKRMSEEGEDVVLQVKPVEGGPIQVLATGRQVTMDEGKLLVLAVLPS